MATLEDFLEFSTKCSLVDPVVRNRIDSILDAGKKRRVLLRDGEDEDRDIEIVERKKLQYVKNSAQAELDMRIYLNGILPRCIWDYEQIIDGSTYQGFIDFELTLDNLNRVIETAAAHRDRILKNLEKSQESGKEEE